MNHQGMHPPMGRHDPVTGMPNRKEFMASYRPRPGAQLVMLTLSEPKQFDELLRAIGHEHAEDFMRAGAVRLREVMDPAIDIYHIGILSFAFIMPFGAMPDLLQKITDHFNKPLTCGCIPVTA